MLNFLGIGAQKAGTTWLYEMLKMHPEITFPAGKEIHFWNRLSSDSSFESYFAHFTSPDSIQGEITPAYAFLPLEIIKKLHHHCPDIRLIYIIRNPIERAWSSAKMALRRAEMEFHEASDQWFIDHFNSKGSLARGDYETCIRNWRTVFTEEQLLILQFDEIKDSPNKILQKCCHHIRVNTFETDLLSSINTHKPVFSGQKQALNSTLNSHLIELYHPKIKQLETYLQISLSHWLDVTSKND